MPTRTASSSGGSTTATISGWRRSDSRGPTTASEDGWAYEAPDGQIGRVELSTLRDGTIDRWEYYEGGIMVRAEEDTSQDGQVDRWEAFANDALEIVAFDENGDGRPDRRLTYGPNGALAAIESEPDGLGNFNLVKRMDITPR